MAIYRTFWIYLTLFLGTVYGQSLIDPCSPPSPCVPGLRIPNPGNCSTYYECVNVRISDAEPRWTRKSCTASQNFNQNTNRCQELSVPEPVISCKPRGGNDTKVDPNIRLNVVNTTRLREGARFQLNCSLFSAVPFPRNLNWLSNKQVITVTGQSRTSIKTEIFLPEPDDFLYFESTLTIDPIHLVDSGDIQCIVEYAIEYENKKSVKYVLFSDVISLQVSRLPYVTLSLDTLTVYSDSNITLTCAVHAGDDRDLHNGRFQWTLDEVKYWNSGDFCGQIHLGVGPHPQNSTFVYDITRSGCNFNSAQIGCVYNDSDGIVTRMEICNVYIIKRGDPVCPMLRDRQLKISWRLTVPGRPGTLKCPRGQEGVCTRNCNLLPNRTALWQDLPEDCSKCRDPPLPKLSEIKDQIDRLEEGVGLGNSSFVASIVNSLANNTNTTTGLNPSSINETVDTIFRLSELRRKFEQFSANREEINSIVSSISNLLQPHNNESWDIIQTEHPTLSTMLLSSADIYGDSLSKLVNQSIDCPVVSVTSENMVLQASCVVATRDVSFPSGAIKGEWTSSSSDRISINIAESGNHPNLRLVSSYYRNIEDYLPGKSNTTFINSKILSLSINGAETGVTKLRQPIEILLQHNDEEGNWTAKCVFWDFSSRDWSEKGCSVLSTNSTQTVCQCDHLTNFAILMSLSPSDGEILSFISTIGCCLTVIALCLTVIAYVITWKYMKSDQTVVLMNLCAALIIANVVFLAGADKTNPKAGCVTVAVLLHYFFLAAFFMMLAEGVELILHIIFVLHVRRTRETVMIILSAWLLPLIIVVVSLGVTRTDGYGNNNACWLSVEKGLIWAFVGPVLFIMTTNFVILIVVLRQVAVGRFPANKNEKKSKIRATVWNIAVISPILGIAWVFGVLSVSSGLVVFQYLFAIANSLQGLLIFIFHVYFNKKLADHIKKTSGYGLLFSRFSSSMETSRNTDSDNANRRAIGRGRVVKDEETIVPKLVKHYEGLSDQEAAAAAADDDRRHRHQKKDKNCMHSMETMTSEIDQSFAETHPAESHVNQDFDTNNTNNEMAAQIHREPFTSF